jgi:hypothetical protein
MHYDGKVLVFHKIISELAIELHGNVQSIQCCNLRDQRYDSTSLPTPITLSKLFSALA